MKMLIYSLIIFMFSENIEFYFISIILMSFKMIFNIKICFININFMMFMIIIFMFFTIIYFKMFKNFYKNIFLSLKLILFSLMMSLLFFLTKNLMLIFMFFEMSIIPVFFYMILFSLTEKKIISAFYLLIYTSIFSFIFMVIMLIELKFMYSSNIMFFLNMIYTNFNIYKLMMMLMFLTKIPLFLIHIWLPKAHVESSALGSMILASILLKLGSYGLMLFMNFLFNKIFLYFLIMYLYMTSIYVLLICFFMNDIKMIIAYFSISHMSLVVVSLILNNYFSFNFCILMMISHSISSPILFFFSMFLYKNYSSRMMKKLNSLFNISNLSSWLMFIFLMFNISIPPSLNFFSELFIFFISLKYLFTLMFFIIFLMLISGLVSIMLILKMMMMKENYSMIYFYQMKMNYIFVFFLLLMISLILIMKLNMF